MDQFIIFANGQIASKNIILPPNYKIIAADGGARHCLKYGFKPQVVIGDFDSLLDSDIDSLKETRVKLIRYPVDKDKTDLELAIEYARELGAKNITLYGVLGGRWDMTFANLLLLTAQRFAEIKFKIIDGNTVGYILHGGETQNLHGKPGTMVSVIPLHTNATGVSYQGLKWTLENKTLLRDSPRGVSNIMINDEAQITLDKGTLLIFQFMNVN